MALVTVEMVKAAFKKVKDDSSAAIAAGMSSDDALVLANQLLGEQLMPLFNMSDSGGGGAGVTEVTVPGDDPIAASIILPSLSLSFKPSGVVAGTYGGLQIPSFTVDQYGRITDVDLVDLPSTEPSGPAGGDLGGTYPSPSVSGLLGFALPSVGITAGGLRWNGSGWILDSTNYALASSLSAYLPLGGGHLSGPLYLDDQTAGWARIGVDGRLVSEPTDSKGFLHFNGLGGWSYISDSGSAFVMADGTTNNSVYLTGNQLIALSGDATGTGTVSIAVTVVRAAKWTTSRTLSVGSTGKLIDGSADVSWSLAEIGAQPQSANLSWLSGASGTGLVYMNSGGLSATTLSNSYLVRGDGSGILSSTFMPASGGTTNKLAKWTSASALGAGIITDDGDFIYADNGGNNGGRFKSRYAGAKATFLGNANSPSWWGIGSDGTSTSLARIGAADGDGNFTGGAFTLSVLGSVSTTNVISLLESGSGTYNRGTISCNADGFGIERPRTLDMSVSPIRSFFVGQRGGGTKFFEVSDGVTYHRQPVATNSHLSLNGATRPNWGSGRNFTMLGGTVGIGQVSSGGDYLMMTNNAYYDGTANRSISATGYSSEFYIGPDGMLVFKTTPNNGVNGVINYPANRFSVDKDGNCAFAGSLAYSGGVFRDLLYAPTYNALYSSGVTPTNPPHNYALAFAKNGADSYLNGTSHSNLAVSGASIVRALSTGCEIAGRLDVTTNISALGAIDAGSARMQTAAFDGTGVAWFGRPGGNSTTWANIYGMRCGAGTVRLHATSDIAMIVNGAEIAAFTASGVSITGSQSNSSYLALSQSSWGNFASLRGNWTSSNNWGIGASTNSNEIKIGVCSSGTDGTWQSTLANVRTNGSFNAGEGTNVGASIYPWNAISTQACFGHQNFRTISSSYAVSQTYDGYTILNAAPSKELYLSVNLVPSVKIKDSGVTILNSWFPNEIVVSGSSYTLPVLPEGQEVVIRFTSASTTVIASASQYCYYRGATTGVAQRSSPGAAVDTASQFGNGSTTSTPSMILRGIVGDTVHAIY